MVPWTRVSRALLRIVSKRRVWTAESVPKRHPRLAVKNLGNDGGVAVLPERAKPKRLNAVGIRVLLLIDGKRTVSSIARTITAEFEVDYERALRDVLSFLKKLDAARMLAGDGGAT